MSVVELVADERKTRVGVAEPVLERDEPELADAGGVTDVGGGGPPEPPYRGRRYGRDRPPFWMRLVLYGMMMIAAFLAGWLCGKVWARIDRAAWGPEPVFGGDR